MADHATQSRLAIRALGSYAFSYPFGLICYAIVRSNVTSGIAPAVAFAFAVLFALLVQLVASAFAIALLFKVRRSERKIPKTFVVLAGLVVVLTLGALVWAALVA